MNNLPNRRMRRRRRLRRRSGGFRMSISIIILIIVVIIVFFVNRDGGVPETGTPYNEQSDTTGDSSEGDAARNDAITLRDKHDMIVWLDAGHGGIDSGTLAILDGVTYLEKDIALNITMMVYGMFGRSDSGITVMLTRSEDVYVHRFDRPALWNGIADLLVSVHINFYEGPTAQTVSGIEVHFDGTSDENTGRVNISNEMFAQIMQNNLVAKTAARDRGIRGHYSWIVTNGSTMPAVLIEAGFMSNPDELALLVTEEYQMKIASAIYDAIVEAFSFS